MFLKKIIEQVTNYQKKGKNVALKNEKKEIEEFHKK